MPYFMDAKGRMVNELGQIAMKHLRHRPALVECNKKGFFFESRADIALTWVDEADVDCLLRVRHGCCGDRPKPVIVFAHEADVRQWTNRGGR